MANAKKQDIELGLTKQEGGRPVRAVLTLKTDKGSRGITSYASVSWHGGGFYTHMLFGDFSVNLLNDQAARATQGAIDRQHAAVFADAKVAELTAAALKFYAKSDLVCGGCEHRFTVKETVTPERIDAGAFACPRCECTDVLTAADYEGAKVPGVDPVVSAGLISPTETVQEVTA